MGDILPGDTVITEDGSATEVLSVHPQGVKPIFRVELDNGAVTRATEDHLWALADGSIRTTAALMEMAWSRHEIPTAGWRGPFEITSKDKERLEDLAVMARAVGLHAEITEGV